MDNHRVPGIEGTVSSASAASEHVPSAKLVSFKAFKRLMETEAETEAVTKRFRMEKRFADKRISTWQ
jgi:hypothetical protein